jgi:hypothetical protein
MGGISKLATHIKIDVCHRFHPPFGPSGGRQLGLHLLGPKGRSQGVGVVAPQHGRGCGGVPLHELLQGLRVGGAAQIPHHHQGPRGSERSHGAPQHGGIVEMVQKAVAHDQVVGRGPWGRQLRQGISREGK